MAQTPQNWAVAADGGYLANTKLSKKMRAYVQPDMVLEQFVRDEEPAIGGTAGSTLEFLKVGNLQQEYATLPINEMARMPESKVQFRKGSITLDEYGLAVPYTDKLERLADFNPRDIVQQALMNHMAKTINQLVYAKFISTRIKYAPLTLTSGRSSTTYPYDAQVGTTAQFCQVNTDGTIPTHDEGAGVSRDIVAADLRYIKTLLADEWKVPSWKGKGRSGKYNYVCVCTETFIQTLLKDDEIRTDLRYADMGAGDAAGTIAGALGWWNGFLFVRDNQALSTKIGPLAVGHSEALIFGDDVLIRKSAMAPTIIAKRGDDDYGRDKGVAWRGIFGFEMVWGNNATDVTDKQIRCIHIKST